MVILNIFKCVYSEVQDAEITAGYEAGLLFKASDQDNLHLLQSFNGIHWNIQMLCNRSNYDINVMLDDGDQTRSYRLSKTRKLDILPKNKLSENSSLAIFLTTRSDEPMHIKVNVTLNNWFQEYNVSDSNVLETVVDKPAESNPSINYFYTSRTFFNDPILPSLSIMSMIPHSSYLLVNIEQYKPFDCCIASLQNVTSLADDEALIKR